MNKRLDSSLKKLKAYEKDETAKFSQAIENKLKGFARDRLTLRNNILIQEEIQSIYSDAKCFILDVGCGQGDMLFFFSDNGYRCVGVEPNSEQLRLARRRLDVQFSLVSGEAESPPFMSGLFNVVTLCGVMGINFLNEFSGMDFQKKNKFFKTAVLFFSDISNDR